MEVGIRELKAHLSSYIERASRGEEVTVTDRGVPVVRLQAIEPVTPPQRIRELVDRGQIEYRPFTSQGLPAPVRMSPGLKTGEDYVREQRR